MRSLYCDLSATPWRLTLGTIDTVYNTNTAQLREPGSCIPPLPILSCYAASYRLSNTLSVFNTSSAKQYSIAKHLNTHISS